MNTLRSPGGCPWDQEQTLDSLRPYLLEEAYEVLHALEHGTLDDHREELGDLLLQVIFNPKFAVNRLSSIWPMSPRQFTRNCASAIRMSSAIKLRTTQKRPTARGKRSKQPSGQHKGNSERYPRWVPDALPALLRAYRIGEKASSVGFDWSSEVGAMSKLREELDEFSEVLAEEDPKTSRLEEEFR